jgi:predicted MFS family arabinose efflux permease
VRERARGIRIALRYRDFKLLWLGQVAGDLGDALGRIALAILVFDETDSSFLAAAVFGVVVLPFLGPGQALTAWAERFPRRSVLIAADCLRAVCYAAIALPMPISMRFALLLLASLADPPFLSVRRAMVPTIVPEDRYSDAVTLTAFTTEACILGGVALAGVLTELIGTEGVLVIDAMTFLASALLIMSMRGGREPAAVGEHVATQLRAGWSAIKSDALVRRLAWLFPLASVGLLGSEALITPFVKSELERSEAVIGWLAASISIGVLATTATLRAHSRHAALVRQSARIAMFGGAVAALGFALPTSLGAATIAYLGVGAVFAFRVPTTVVLGQRLADSIRASALSVLDSGYAVAQLVAAFGAGALAEFTDPQRACFALAVFTVAVGVVSALLPVRRSTSVDQVS